MQFYLAYKKIFLDLASSSGIAFLLWFDEKATEWRCKQRLQNFPTISAIVVKLMMLSTKSAVYGPLFI